MTPPKCGSTWMQTIVALLCVSDPRVQTDLSVRMAHVNIRIREMAQVFALLEAITDTQSMISHTPIDGLPLRLRARNICVSCHPQMRIFPSQTCAQHPQDMV